MVIPAHGTVTVNVRAVIDQARPERKLASSLRVFTNHPKHREIRLSFELQPLRKIDGIALNQKSVFTSGSDFWRNLSNWIISVECKNRIGILFEGEQYVS